MHPLALWLKTIATWLRGHVSRRDYVSPDLRLPRLDRYFPNMVEGDQALVSWPHFRKGLSHPWYVDRRWPTVGFLNKDEVSLLYANALQFRARKGLEIGVWRGWSAAHILKAGVMLDLVDPVLSDPVIQAEIEASFRRAHVLSRATFHAGSSPEQVVSLAEAGRRWSFIFIDGDHEGEAPRRDALICARFAEESAMIMFHDLMAPAVADGLRTLRELGWSTRLYQTAQIMGVAWRGTVSPVAHLADPTQDWSVPAYLEDLVSRGSS